MKALIFPVKKKWDNFQIIRLAWVLIKKNNKKKKSCFSPGLTEPQLHWNPQRFVWLLQGWTGSSQHKVLHPHRSSLPAVLPGGGNLECFLQKWQTAWGNLSMLTQNALSPRSVSLLLKATFFGEGPSEQRSEAFPLVTTSDTPLKDWLNLLNQISSWNISHSFVVFFTLSQKQSFSTSCAV